MAGTEFELRQEAPVRRNEDLPDDQAYSMQETTLTSKDGSNAAEIQAYLDRGYYSFHWPTTTPESELTQLVEECVSYYKQNFAEGVADLNGEKTNPSGQGLPDNKYASGVIIYVSGNGKGDKLELDYRKPLSWEQIAKAANGRKVSLARFNTPIGDFCIHQSGDNRVFGVISHLKETAGFANLLIKSTSENISPKQAQELLDTAISAFPDKSQL